MKYIGNTPKIPKSGKIRGNDKLKVSHQYGLRRIAGFAPPQPWRRRGRQDYSSTELIEVFKLLIRLILLKNLKNYLGEYKGY